MAGKSGWVAITDSLGISRFVLPVPCGIRGMMNAIGEGKKGKNKNHLILLARPLLMSNCLSVYCEGCARAIGKMEETSPPVNSDDERKKCWISFFFLFRLQTRLRVGLCLFGVFFWVINCHPLFYFSFEKKNWIAPAIRRSRISYNFCIL